MRRRERKHSGLRLLALNLAFAFTPLSLPAMANLSAAPCSQTSTEQDKWVAQSVNALVRSAHAAYENDQARARYERILIKIDDTIKRCGLKDDRDFVARYPELVEYVKLLSLSLKEDHELGFEVSDKVYFTETSGFTSIPDFLLTPQFLRTVSRFETLPQAKALLQEMNSQRANDEQLLFFSYMSRHLGTPDNSRSFRRLLIVVPGNAAASIPEKWVQFGLADARSRTSVRNISVVAVLPGPQQTSNVYFKDYFRTFRRMGRHTNSITVKGRWELGEGDDNCVECHKSGVLPIFPVKGSVSREDEPVLDAVNQRFRAYGPPRFDGYLDAGKFGPGLGSIRRGERTAGNTVNTASCASCHHPNGLGALNWPMDRKVISSFVKGGQMPLGARLEHSERSQLYQQLIRDYFAIDNTRPGTLKAWLLGKSPK